MSEQDEKVSADEQVSDVAMSVPSRRNTKRIGLWVAAAITVLVLMVLVAVIVARMNKPNIVAFDMKGTMDLFIQQSVKQQLNEQKAKDLTSRFNQALSDSLGAWQEKHHAIILVSPAVVSSVPDITAEIQTDISERMRERDGR